MPWIVDTPFGFSVDLSIWQDIFSLPPPQIVSLVFAIVGWTVLALVFFYMGSELWKEYRQKKYTSKWKWIVLAIDVPALFIQTPKAVEQIFAHLSGAKTTPNVGQKYWLGKKQKSFSFEIISIEGYIQFLVRTESEFRDLVEAAIYAQYTEAEITEVEDYVDAIPSHYPDSEYDMHAVEFSLHEPDAFPLRTYPSFEYNLSKDAVFSDPMAAILENFSRVGHGENVWMQILIEPTNNKWKEKGIDLVKEIIANGGHSGGGHGGHGGGHGGGGALSGLMYKILQLPQWLLKELMNAWNATESESHDSHEEEHVGKLSDLSPGFKATVEAIEMKIAKIGFKSKVRVLYAAHHNVFNPGPAIDGLIGAMNQFHVMSSNALVPHHITEAYYAFKKWRLNYHKHHFMHAYKKRKLKALGNPYILNIEELATIWHFPLPFVKTPLLQKAGAKRAEPPNELPVELSEGRLKKKLSSVTVEPLIPPVADQAPEDLPFG